LAPAAAGDTSGNRDRARYYVSHMVEMTSPDSSRHVLAWARQYLAGK
jgi:hypothetical protein